MNKDITLFDEIADQDLDQANGGTFTVPGVVVSWYLGNKGQLCTATKECMPNCR